MENILKVIVGSRLHRLHNEDSDYDYRGIFKDDLINILSPFKKQRTTSWIEGKDDDTSYELLHFVKMAASGNMTIYEILWSDLIVDSSDIGSVLRNNREKFLSKERVYNSSLGYASNQMKKSSIDNPDKNTPKAVVAYIRVLRQAIELLSAGNFNPSYDYHDKNFIMDIKYDFRDDMVPKISKLFIELRKDLENAYKNSILKEEADIEWIENFILDVYKELQN